MPRTTGPPIATPSPLRKISWLEMARRDAEFGSNMRWGGPQSLGFQSGKWAVVASL